MARSSKVDALEKFRFTISWDDGLTRAGFHDVSIPKQSVTKGEYREGNAPDNVQLFPGLAKMEDVTMSRGMTTNQDFYGWAKLVFDPTAMPEGQPNVQKGDVVPLGQSTEFRKNITITLWRRDGVPSKQWILYNAFPVSFHPSSDLNASEDNEKAMEQLVVGYETFEDKAGSAISEPKTGQDQSPLV
jgi:phage tail-like protein